MNDFLSDIIEKTGNEYAAIADNASATIKSKYVISFL